MCEKDQAKKKRAPRTTKKQIEIITAFIEANPKILTGATNGTEVPQNSRLWEQLTEELNQSGIGPQKTKNQWKAVVSELKTNIKKKARQIVVAKKATGGGPTVKELTATEEKLYMLINPVSVEGSPNISEIGIEDVDSNINSRNNPAEEILGEVTKPIDSGKDTTPHVHHNPRKTMRIRKRKSPLETATEEQCKMQKITANALEKLAASVEFLGTAIIQLSSTLASTNATIVSLENSDVQQEVSLGSEIN